MRDLRAEPMVLSVPPVEKGRYYEVQLEDGKVMYEYAVDRNSGQFKAPFNQIFNEARVFT